ncbi:MAG: ABC transporter permease [Candidatus Geothermarchaeales archaeon]
MNVGKEYRTFKATFVSTIKSVIRYYTPTGYVASYLLLPITMIATAWVVSRIVSPTGSPDFFVQTTGYTDYLTFVIVGYAFNGVMFSSVNRGGEAVYREQVEGTLEMIMLTPSSRFTWILSKTSASILDTVFSLFTILLLGEMLFGLEFHGGLNVVVALAGALLTLVALEGVSLVFVGIGLVLKQPHVIAVLLQPVVIFLSGMMFPVESLPQWIQPISGAIPLTYGLNIVRRSLLLGWDVEMLSGDFLVLAVFAVVLIPVGYYFYRALEKRAMQTGAIRTF